MTEWNWRWKRYKSDCGDSRTMKMNDRIWDVGPDPNLVKMNDSRRRDQLSPRGSCEAGNQHSTTHDSQIITKLKVTINQPLKVTQAGSSQEDRCDMRLVSLAGEWVKSEFVHVMETSVCLIHLRSWLFPERHTSSDHPACARRCDCSFFTFFKPSASSLHNRCTPLLLPRTPPPIIPSPQRRGRQCHKGSYYSPRLV